MPLAVMSVRTGTNEDWVEAIKYVVGVETGPQLDLRGISFSMEVRRNAPDHEVILHGSTDDGKLAVAAAPDVGFLLFFIPYSDMVDKVAGDYVADVVGTDDTFSRVVIQMNLTIVKGITRLQEKPGGVYNHIVALLPNLTDPELHDLDRAVASELMR